MHVRAPAHPGVSLWRPATVADLDALMALYAACDPIDSPTSVTTRAGVADIFAAAETSDPARDTLLGLDASGRINAYGTVRTHPDRRTDVFVDIDGKVHPDVRRHGIGTQLLRWQLDRTRQALAETGLRHPGAVFLYAAERDAGTRALAEKCGLRVERWFATMTRDLRAPFPTAPELPEGVTIIPFADQYRDAARLARNDAFRDHWGSLATHEAAWHRSTENPNFSADLTRLCILDDDVVAFAMAFTYRESWQAQGFSSIYIDLIGVPRAWRGRGLAPAVITAALRAAADAGLDKATLEVDLENPSGAQHLYASLGFELGDREAIYVTRY